MEPPTRKSSSHSDALQASVTELPMTRSPWAWMVHPFCHPQVHAADNRHAHPHVSCGPCAPATHRSSNRCDAGNCFRRQRRTGTTVDALTTQLALARLPTVHIIAEVHCMRGSSRRPACVRRCAVDATRACAPRRIVPASNCHEPRPRPAWGPSAPPLAGAYSPPPAWLGCSVACAPAAAAPSTSTVAASTSAAARIALRCRRKGTPVQCRCASLYFTAHSP